MLLTLTLNNNFHGFIAVADELSQENDHRRVHGVCVGDGPDWLVCIYAAVSEVYKEDHKVMCVLNPYSFPIFS